ncbi:tRNA-dihydrouridine(20) synthase [NAD(P)+]-like [Sitodiplosis mosellana]|uniref:tRNA-dihydrouridine(20) synthase [NAD(P)+]-like n=1 Tax=Sitodiplosis mosellana TaxID=263140 RepID=UPI0024441653|nr:tRNA-dihydrouridine(20) synthase [NAD(P)+]-like [Sitodiplosis mosellana]
MGQKEENSVKMDTDEAKIDYRNKICLAPMVKIGTLATRLLSLRYGADLVYTEEIIDFKFLGSYRYENEVLGTVDFVDKNNGALTFRTCPLEKGKVVLQLGTANAERALKVAKMVENDVAAIDINMGCPKAFSLKGGMGAALLTDPERAKNILNTLVQNVKIPVTCKIRILNNPDDTIKLAEEFEATGISAIGVHGRKKDERPHHPNNTEAIRKIAERLKIPVIANGGSRDIDNYDDILKFRHKCGTTSVMIARAAEWNVSVFRKEGKLPLDEVITEYLKLCIDFDSSPNITKYCVQMMLRELQETPRGKKFLECQTLNEICDIWDLGDYCRKTQREYEEKGMHCRRSCVPDTVLRRNEDGTDSPCPKRIKVSNDPDIYTRSIAYFRAHYTEKDMPKVILHTYAHKNGLNIPTYETNQEDSLFQTVITFQGKKYASSYWEKNKRFAEQAAALVCLLGIDLVKEEDLIKKGSLLNR